MYVNNKSITLRYVSKYVDMIILHTIADSSCSTSFSETIPLSHRTTEAHIHKELSVFRQRSATTQYQPYTTPQKITHLGEDESEEKKL